MICSDCLEDYVFFKFDVDPMTLEHRGVFKCQCRATLVLPEDLTREILEEQDLLDQIALSKRMHMKNSMLTHRAKKPVVDKKAIELKTDHLERYIQDVSKQTLRQFKWPIE